MIGEGATQAITLRPGATALPTTGVEVSLSETPFLSPLPGDKQQHFVRLCLSDLEKKMYNQTMLLRFMQFKGKV